MAKRIASSSVNWAFISETLAPEDLAKTVSLRLLTEKYLREIAGKPSELPKIDWKLYKSRIATPGVVETFQKSYEALKVPYPSDQGLLSKMESSNAKIMQFSEQQCKQYQEIVLNLQEELKKLESVPRLVDMTLEELYMTRPELRIDYKKIVV